MMEMESTAGFWVWVVVVVPLAALLWWWNDCWYALPLRLRRGGSGAKLPPGYMGLPFLGEMPAFLWYFKFVRRPDDFINAKRRRYGEGIGLYRTYLLGSPTIIACTPSANKLVLQESNFGTGWNPKLVGATSLVAVVGSAHTRLRAFVLKAVNQPDALRKITLMVQPRVMAALNSWSHKGRITVLKEAKKVTLASIGKYFADIEEEHILDTLDDLLKGIINGVKSFPLNLPGTALHYALKCRRKADAILREELEKRKKSEATAPKNDLMEALMQMKDEEGIRLTEVEILDNMVTLLLGGYVATSVTIMFALYYLAKYPDVLQKLREEHMAMGKRNGELVTYDEIASCKYTSKVVEETIRLATVSTFVLRTTTKDVEYRGYKIPKGWNVACWLGYLHTDPENYEDPLWFNPERWNEAPKAGSYLAFGGGPRICAGNMFARLQLGVVLHHLVLGYRWKLVNPNVEMTYLPHPNLEDELEIDITQI